MAKRIKKLRSVRTRFIEHGEPLDEWMGRFRGLPVIGWEKHQDGTVLDFGKIGLLLEDRFPGDECLAAIFGERLTSWQNMPNVIVGELAFDEVFVLEFGKTGLMFPGPMMIRELVRINDGKEEKNGSSV